MYINIFKYVKVLQKYDINYKMCAVVHIGVQEEDCAGSSDVRRRGGGKKRGKEEKGTGKREEFERDLK